MSSLTEAVGSLCRANDLGPTPPPSDCYGRTCWWQHMALRALEFGPRLVVRATLGGDRWPH
eukprot:14888314-Alexandrium_andersonii.AAC.1